MSLRMLAIRRRINLIGSSFDAERDTPLTLRRQRRQRIAVALVAFSSGAWSTPLPPCPVGTPSTAHLPRYSGWGRNGVAAESVVWAVLLPYVLTGPGAVVSLKVKHD